MPDVISNTSPIQYLYQLGFLDILKKLYGQVMIPYAVLNELSNGRKQGIELPDPALLNWINIRHILENKLLPVVTGLGAGEKEVLALGIQSSDALVILDDLLARQYASFLGLKITGTLGIILKAKQLNEIDNVKYFLNKLEQLDFRLDKKTRSFVLKLAGES
jgi:predicted nucleic acid-binding protein